MKPNMPQRAALTLIELLIVIAIMSVLVGLLMVAIVKTRGSAVRTQSENNLKQIVLAVHGYASANQTRLPVIDRVSFPGPTYGPSFFYSLLPYLEQNFDENAPIHPMPIFISPADPTAGLELIHG